MAEAIKNWPKAGRKMKQKVEKPAPCPRCYAPVREGERCTSYGCTGGQS